MITTTLFKINLISFSSFSLPCHQLSRLFASRHFYRPFCYSGSHHSSQSFFSYSSYFCFYFLVFSCCNLLSTCPVFLPTLVVFCWSCLYSRPLGSSLVSWLRRFLLEALRILPRMQTETRGLLCLQKKWEV